MQVSLSFNFGMGRSTVCSILRETCEALWEVLVEKHQHHVLSGKELVTNLARYGISHIVLVSYI